jgi:hypothetical protein
MAKTLLSTSVTYLERSSRSSGVKGMGEG